MNRTTLPRRETEIKEVYTFARKHLVDRTAGSMYISGAPGTGKTAVVTHVLEKLENPENFESDVKLEAYRFVKVLINCMSTRKQNVVLKDIANQMKIRLDPTVEDIKESIVKRITSKSPRVKAIVMVLDEMDQLLTSASKELLYTIFEWTRIPGSRLIIFGIANALDLAVQHLPKLFASLKFRTPTRVTNKVSTPSTPVTPDPCHSMSFSPYGREDIEFILEDRLKRAAAAESEVFESAAIKFVAMKVAATTGDMRKALSACRLALQSLKKETSSTPVRSPLKRIDGTSSPSPKKKQCLNSGEKIGVAAVAKLFVQQKTEDLPLQQAVILATLLRINRQAPNSKNSTVDGVLTPVPYDTIYAEHHKICKLGFFNRIESSDIPSYCAQLQDRSLVTVIENSQGRKKGIGKTNKAAGIIFDPKSAEIALRNDAHLKVVIDS